MPKLRLLLLAALFSLPLPGAAAARAGDVGPVAVLGRGASDLSGAAVVVQGDGRATVAGSNDGRAFLVARVRPDGRADVSFGRRGSTSIRFPGASAAGAKALALFRDGRILVAGTVRLGGVRRLGVARLLPGGRLDPNFGSRGVAVAGPRGARLEAMALQPDGQLVLAGSVPAGPRRAVLVVRLLPDGSRDGSFGTGGAVDSTAVGLAGRARDVAVLPDGRIVLAASPERGRSEPATFVAARLTPGGAFDPSFGSGGVARVSTTSRRVRDGGAAALALGSRRRLILAGTARGGGGREDATVVRIDADGSSAVVRRLIDPRRRATRIVAMRRDARGRLVLTGRVAGLGGAVLRLRGDLRRDRAFAAGGLLAGPLRRTRPAGLALRRGAIVLAGSARQAGHERLVVARVRP